MKRSIRIASLLMSVMLGGCAYQHELLVNPEFSLPEKVSMTKMEKAVHETLFDIGWAIDQEEPGATTAHIKQGELFASIRVEYSDKNAKVRYLESKNFKYTKLPSGEERIHAHYLLWANHIANNLRDRLKREYHVE